MSNDYIYLDSFPDSESNITKNGRQFYINERKDIHWYETQINDPENYIQFEDKHTNDESEKDDYINDKIDPSINSNYILNKIFEPNQNSCPTVNENDTNNIFLEQKREREKKVEKKNEKQFKIVESKTKNLHNGFYIFNPGNKSKKIRIEIDNYLQDVKDKNNIINNIRRHSSIKKKRKDNSDNIRKKIKSRFIKALIKCINKKLKKAGSKKFFSLLPHIFVINITKEINTDIFDKTFEEVFSINFDNILKKTEKADLIKYKKNIDVLDYLENEIVIRESSNYNYYKNLKFYQIFDEYLGAQEFENEIEKLKLSGEKDEYIDRYIKLACYFNSFFSK